MGEHTQLSKTFPLYKRVNHNSTIYCSWPFMYEAGSEIGHLHIGRSVENKRRRVPPLTCYIRK